MVDCENVSFVILIIACIGFSFCFFAQFITLSVWFSRISPYFKHAEDYGSKIYKMLSSNFYIYLTIFVISILIIIILVLCRGNGFFEMFIFLNVGIIIIYVIASAISMFFHNYAIFDQIKYSSELMKKGNCFKYIVDGINGADSYYGEKANYIKWRSNLITKAIEDYNHTTKYICQSVYSPTMAFDILLLIFFFTIVILLIFACGHRNFYSFTDTAIRAGEIALKLLP